VDIRLAKHVDDVSPYRAVVLGSAVQRAAWLSEAIDFAEKHSKELSRMPVAYFLTCLTLYQDTPETRRLAQSYMEPVLKAAPEVQPRDFGLFAGVLDYSKMNWIVRMVMKAKMRDKEYRRETSGTGTQSRHGQRTSLCGWGTTEMSGIVFGSSPCG